MGPSAEAGEDQTVVYGTPVQMQGSGSGSYEWRPTLYLSDPTAGAPVFTAYETTRFVLTVRDENGCVSSDVVTVTVKPQIDPEKLLFLLESQECCPASGIGN